jgi:protoporphyrinogen oxidase
MKKKIAVIGAGPAGLTAAYQLTKAGLSVDIYEAGPSVGGMAKTIKLWGRNVDLGPHRFFSSDHRVNAIWLEVVGKDYKMVNRLTRIYYKDTFFDYPLKAFNALNGLGFFQSIFCVLSYLKSKFIFSAKPKTFEEWVIKRFGRRLFNIFFKSYSEKLWGIKCGELDAEFAVQRIKKLSLYEAIKSALVGNQGTKHKTLVDEFAYPVSGAGQAYENMADYIKKKNLIFLRSPIKSAKPIGKNNTKPKIELSDGNTKEYDHIISTMPITELVKQMDAEKEIIDHSKSLKFRNTILVYLNVDGENLFPDQWVYIHNEKLKTGRITNFNNWLPKEKNRSNTILCLEYWCYDEDDIWNSADDKLINIAKEDIHKSSLFSDNNKILEGKVIKIPKCYPVYKSGYKNHLKPIENFLSKQRGLSVIGRYGSFKYNNQDHSILMGILAAENIIKNTNHNLWELNTDYEYQESSKISSTGLIKE